MKKRYLLLCIFLLGISNLFSQSKTDKKESYITFDAFSTIYSYSPKWRLGYYREINDRFILGATMGIGNYDVSFNFLKETDWIESDYFIIEFSPELYYVLTPGYRVKHFISSELFYIYHTDRLKNDSYRNETDFKYYHYDSADYQRQKFGLNVNYGIIVKLFKRFGIMPKIGLGVKYRDVNFSNVVNPAIEDSFDVNRCFSINNTDFREIEGAVTKLNLDFKVNIFYRF